MTASKQLSEMTAPALAELQPVTLSGKRVTVRPLGLDDAADMYKFGSDEKMWKFMPRSAFSSVDDARGFIEEALQQQASGHGVPFTIRTNDDQTLIGHLRFLDPQPIHGSVEIGWVMITPDLWRARLALEASFLLFIHAFESLGVTRVWMKTDAKNQSARRTMEVGGMTYEGTLRKHGLVRPGYIRDSAIYSVISDEWPEKSKECAAVVEAAAEADLGQNS